MTDILLRKAQSVRAGAQGDNDYDVIGPDGLVIGRIFKVTTSPGTWMWTLAYGDQRTERLRTEMRQHAKPLCRHSLRVKFTKKPRRFGPSGAE
jgi:hypothetical protein